MKERELNELIVSFKEMAGRLEQLEHSRNYMLAGLMHELKTPVTSVKGLVHAVKEKVVQNEDADEFLRIALQETGRLERMVADLLDYNALAAGLVQLNRQNLDAAALLTEIIYQWTLHQDEDIREPELLLSRQPIEIEGDRSAFSKLSLICSTTSYRPNTRTARSASALYSANGRTAAPKSLSPITAPAFLCPSRT
nr:histidine kinase dimerization/phospho-acceptor domain-containing protein [Paenibacillus harenae]